MQERRINLNFSELWVNPNNKFIVRFLDINEQRQKMFAKRIKQTAKYRRIRNENGPTEQEIYELLSEINPIIFSEKITDRGWHSPNSPQNFNFFQCHTIANPLYRILCKIIYIILCLKKPLKTKEMSNLIYLICGDWNLVTEWRRTHYPEIPELNPHAILANENPRREVEEISLDIIEQARRRVTNGPEDRGEEENANEPIMRSRTIIEITPEGIYRRDYNDYNI